MLQGLPGLPGHAYFAVFDGHAGVEAATYAKCHLLCNIVRHPLFTKDVTKAIGEAIVTTDKNFCTKAEEEVCVLKISVICLNAYLLYCFLFAESA